MESKTNGNPKPAETKPKAAVKPATPKADIPKLQSQPESPKLLNMTDITKEINTLWQAVSQQNKLIVELQEAVARKRRAPASNGKVQIRDRKTGRIFPSKNGCYQTLLREGALKDLVDKGVFGDLPSKNNFGWYQLVREWPDRFEELTDKPNREDITNDEKAKATSTVISNAK